jgi:DUF1365 family protein
MTGGSALYFGTVMHRRSRPRRHFLRYRMFWMLLDLDELTDIDRRLLPFGYNRFNILSFHDRDHGDGSAVPLRTQIDRRLADAGISAGGAIRLLTMPRVVGYVFNPISIYFCHRPDATLAAILYEVHNTFGERHTYIYPAGATQLAAHDCAKAFHVSPFLNMNMEYEFRTCVPDENLSIAVLGSDCKGAIITAVMAGERRSLDIKHLFLAVALFPLLTLKVILAIHWNALLLWIKRIPVHTKPRLPSRPVTIIRPEVGE